MSIKLEDIESKSKAALKFFATWCSPCKIIDPHFEKMRQEFENIEFFSINVDEEPLLTNHFKIKNVPAVLLLNEGEEFNRIIGAVKISAFRAAFRDFSFEKS